MLLLLHLEKTFILLKGTIPHVHKDVVTKKLHSMQCLITAKLFKNDDGDDANDEEEEDGDHFFLMSRPKVLYRREDDDDDDDGGPIGGALPIGGAVPVLVH